MSTFSSAYDEKIRPLMDKIDQARSLLSLNDDGISFPTVVVVGDQSSGKSTLLESLSLVELPKGAGIVTRCPLVLRLRKSDERRLYQLKGKKQIPLDEKKMNIMKYIETETRKLAGDNKNVVSELIELQVEDPDARDLTVVDLPGIARNPIADQPKDIHKQTTNLIRKFIGQEGTVILCVFPANVDVATVESFTLAREVDPKGTRTIGVITKSDLASNNDLFIQQLLMERSDVLHLKLGFIAVRSRTTEESMSLKDARKREKTFFNEHPASRIAKHCLGIDALINRLADLYSERVKETFPQMRLDVQSKLKEIREKLSKFPPALDSTVERLAKYYELANWYLENMIQKRLKNSKDSESSSHVNNLHKNFEAAENLIRQKQKQLFTPDYNKQVKQMMQSCFGEQLPNFLPYPVLKSLINERIEELSVIMDELIDDCFEETLNLFLADDEAACANNVLLLKLLPTFRNVVREYLNDKTNAISEQLQEMIRLEKQEPYTLNHYYMNNIDRLREQIQEQKALKLNTGFRVATKLHSERDDESKLLESISNDDKAVQEMIISVHSYWKVLVKRFMDYAALRLRAGYVFDIFSGIQERLQKIPVAEADFVDVHLTEDTCLRSKRQQLQEKKERLERVDHILSGSHIISGKDIVPKSASVLTLEKSKSTTVSTDSNQTSSVTFNTKN